MKKFRLNAANRYTGLIDEKYIDRAKDKTPSMGGLLIVFAIFISSMLWNVLNNPIAIALIVSMLAFAAIGFVDDYFKVAFQKRDGIPGRAKLVFQFIIAGAAIFFIDCMPGTHGQMWQLMVPFMKEPLLVSPWLMVFTPIVVVGSSNAVNLTDGKDGLAVGCTIFAALALALFAYLSSHKVFAVYLSIPMIPGTEEAVVFALALAGACIGFLWWNCHPASMFMGDTGSLALGGVLGLIAVFVKQELTLAIIGGVFVIEALSVIIQVGVFKKTGRRVFHCAPIHHHFERLGWTETQIVVRFWILAGIFAMLGLATLKLR
ncbi:MAG: phospho-N-acetylmuramoyl-pentapeptide-transferase [Victivallaceae bacterium]|nr:phospho-N-acetylmuramoyl-pentapeptide-transferase [Victivallaceae bacterium]